ncbi:MAG: LamG-like jellyroll fold domain-containing protein, partial [Planctomycetota bacterium]
GVIVPDEWAHFAYSYDSAEGRRLYKDGSLIFEDTQSGTPQASTTSLAIGNEQPMSRYVNGAMDDIRIYNNMLSEAEILAAMEGAEGYPYALGADPEDGALHEDTWVNLSWSAGDLAVSHDVYLGDNFDDVNDGTPDSLVFRGNQDDTFLVAGFPGFPYADGLVPGTTYYWRIDEVNDTEPNSPWKGDIWSFSIPPKTAYSPDPADGAEFVDPNVTLSWTPGFGAKLHTVYFGDNFDDVNDAAGGLPQALTTFSPASPLELEKVYYWRVDEFDVVATYKGDIWSFTTPGAVGNPQPANGAVDVQMIATLSWTPADNAASHELYFGADADAVKNATTASPEYIGPRALGAESYDPGGLAWDSSYAWRVDEVYPDGTVKGLVWSFATADFILVDDFESYNDIDPPDPNSNRIFDKWIDGFGTTDNGALVGNDLPPYAEQTIVHGGAQSMIYRYDNANKTSEATMTLIYPHDWTEEGVTKLSLWFRGASGNSAERMFVALNGTALVYHADDAATQTTRWTEWVIDLTEFAGVDLTNVNSISIGFGTKNSPAVGGAGTMYFDDIRLYR